MPPLGHADVDDDDGGCARCCCLCGLFSCFCDDDNDDEAHFEAALGAAYGLSGATRDRARTVELRLWPHYNAKGEFIDSGDGDGDDDGDGSRRRTVYLCRWIVPWCLARALTRLGLDCGLRLSTGGLPGWLLGTAAGRRCLLTLFLVLLLGGATYLAWSRGRQLERIWDSPCYVCRPRHQAFTAAARGPGAAAAGDGGGVWTETTRAALNRYGQFAYGPACALDDGWAQAIDRVLDPGGVTGNHTNGDVAALQNTTAWQRYDVLPALLNHGRPSQPPPPLPTRFEEDWHHAVPSVFVLGCRGAGTTSLAHYLSAHPDLEVRRGFLGGGDSGGDKGAKDPEVATVAWDDHFFAANPHWAPEELRAWTRRGWGPPALRDHQGRGRTRIEVGPDYLWLSQTGAAGAIRRARPQGARFVVLMADPVRLVREAHARALDAGLEQRSLAQTVADELPALARCLGWDAASDGEQRERIVSGLCGAAEPGRLGPPYLWRGLASEFLAHWLRTLPPTNTGGTGQRWYFVRSEDLMQQPNRTLNRIVGDLLGLRPWDFGLVTRKLWHPPPEVTRILAPRAPWKQSWEATVPRTDYIQHLRKRAADALLDAAQRAIMDAVPGLEAGLAARDKLKRLHCSLAGLLSHGTGGGSSGNGGGTTVGAQRCLESGGGGGATATPSSATSDATTTTTTVTLAETMQRRKDEADRAEALALDLLRDFYEPYQARWVDLAMTASAMRWASARDRSSPGDPARPSSSTPPPPPPLTSGGPPEDPDAEARRLRDFYLGRGGGG